MNASTGTNRWFSGFEMNDPAEFAGSSGLALEGEASAHSGNFCGRLTLNANVAGYVLGDVVAATGWHRVGMYVKFNGLPTAERTLMYVATGGNTLELRVSNTGLLSIYCAASAKANSGAFLLSTLTWYGIEITWDKTTGNVNLYVDGVSRATVTNDADVKGTQAPTVLAYGPYAGAIGGTFDAWLDDLHYGYLETANPGSIGTDWGVSPITDPTASGTGSLWDGYNGLQDWPGGNNGDGSYQSGDVGEPGYFTKQKPVESQAGRGMTAVLVLGLLKYVTTAGVARVGLRKGDHVAYNTVSTLDTASYKRAAACFDSAPADSDSEWSGNLYDTYELYVQAESGGTLRGTALASIALYTAGGGASGNPPSAPTGLAAAPISSSKIRLDWADNSSDELGFEVWRSEDNVTFDLITVVPAGTVSYVDEGLAANTRYYYQVRAYNGGGFSAYAGPVSADTFPVGTGGADGHGEDLPDSSTCNNPYAELADVQALIPADLLTLSVNSEPSVQAVAAWLCQVSLWVEGTLRWKYDIPITDGEDRERLRAPVALLTAALCWDVLEQKHPGQAEYDRARRLRAAGMGALIFNPGGIGSQQKGGSAVVVGREVFQMGRSMIVLPNSTLAESGEAALGQPLSTFREPGEGEEPERLFGLGKEW